ncbi:HTH_48 domain-containing protein [Trichonephila clavipes]|nr:HTH_48 domain-containing protein [Trichonephila clavipes]
MENLRDQSFIPTNLGRIDEEMILPGRRGITSHTLIRISAKQSPSSVVCVREEVTSRLPESFQPSLVLSLPSQGFKIIEDGLFDPRVASGSRVGKISFLWFPQDKITSRVALWAQSQFIMKISTDPLPKGGVHGSKIYVAQLHDVSAFVKLERIEYRAVIKYLFLKGNTTTQIKDELDSVYGNSIPSFTLVKFWAAEFKRGHKSLGDDERSGRPNTATTDENITKFH